MARLLKGKLLSFKNDTFRGLNDTSPGWWCTLTVEKQFLFIKYKKTVYTPVRTDVNLETMIGKLISIEY